MTNTGGNMNADIQELIEKYQDVIDSSDDWVEKNLGQEVIEDLRDLLHG
jgi:hypothetical protein